METTAMTNPPAKAVHIRLDGNAVVAPVQRAVRDSLEVLSIALAAIENTNPTKIPSMPGGGIVLTLRSPEPIDVVERKTAYTNWLLSKAFQELARSISEALQEAYLYVEVFDMRAGPATWEEFMDTEKAIRQRANKMHFPELLSAVSSRLDTPLIFADEYSSLQKVRNCLEHRAGLVTDREVDTNGTLTLRFPTIYVVVKTGDEEVIVADQEKLRVEEDAIIQVKFGHLNKEYKQGERVVLTPLEFQGICRGCMQFCADLGHKLPVRSIVLPEGPHG
jgi:hypothetical protein